MNKTLWVLCLVFVSRCLTAWGEGSGGKILTGDHSGTSNKSCQEAKESAYQQYESTSLKKMTAHCRDQYKGRSYDRELPGLFEPAYLKQPTDPDDESCTRSRTGDKFTYWSTKYVESIVCRSDPHGEFAIKPKPLPMLGAQKKKHTKK